MRVQLAKFFKCSIALLVCCIFYIMIIMPKFTDKLRKDVSNHGYTPLLLEWSDGNLEYLGNINKMACGKWNCLVTGNQSFLSVADVVVFQGLDGRHQRVETLPLADKPAGQTWIMIVRESPANIKYLRTYEQVVNKFFDMIATYRITDTDISIPIAYTIKRENLEYVPDVLKEKKSLALWMMSHCSESIQNRVANQLGRYINIEVFGGCSNRTIPCPGKAPTDRCINHLMRNYNFYLAFENSQCEEYITEKFWRPLMHHAVPIVLGAPLKDYITMAPPDSFLHVSNFSSVEKLAEYILYLDRNDEAYMKYHQWRKHYIVHHLNNNICRICEKLHKDHVRNVTSKLTHRKFLATDIWSPNKTCSFNVPIKLNNN